MFPVDPLVGNSFVADRAPKQDTQTGAEITHITRIADRRIDIGGDSSAQALAAEINVEPEHRRQSVAPVLIEPAERATLFPSGETDPAGLCNAWFVSAEEVKGPEESVGPTAYKIDPQVRSSFVTRSCAGAARESSATLLDRAPHTLWESPTWERELV